MSKSKNNEEETIGGIHGRLIRSLREALASDLASAVHGMTDEQLLRAVFHSLRGKPSDPKGLRLSPAGYALVSRVFRPYPILMPDDYVVGLEDLLWLDSRAKMPYYVGRADGIDGKDQLIVFEARFGIMLKLADGMISTLREIEAFRYRFKSG